MSSAEATQNDRATFNNRVNAVVDRIARECTEEWQRLGPMLHRDGKLSDAAAFSVRGRLMLRPDVELFGSTHTTKIRKRV